MKYSAKKTNTDEQQRAKTVDIVRLKAGNECLFVFSSYETSSISIDILPWIIQAEGSLWDNA